MAATRKDYEAVAAGLRRTRPESDNGATYLQWRRDVDAVARVLHDTGGLNVNGNRRFDIDRFVAACEAITQKEVNNNG